MHTLNKFISMFLTLGASLLGIWTATVGAATVVPVAATLVSSPVQVPAGKTVTLSASFSSLPRRTTIATSAFEVTHERPLHLVGVGQDLDTFLHWHPSNSTPTAFLFTNVTFPKAGTYFIAVDGQLAEGPVANHTKLMVTGTPQMNPPKPAAAAAAAATASSTDAFVTVRGVPFQIRQPAVSLSSLVVASGSSGGSSGGSNVYKVKLTGPQGRSCTPGKPISYVWTLSHGSSGGSSSGGGSSGGGSSGGGSSGGGSSSGGSSSTNKLVTDLRMYYGAPMHLAVVRDDLGSIEHVHGDIANSGSSSSDNSSSTGASMLTGQHAATPKAAAAAAAAAAVEGHNAHGRKLLQQHTDMADMSGMAPAAPVDHAMHAGAVVPAVFGPDVQTTVVFPAAGRYLLVGQVLRGQELILLPLFVPCLG